MSFKQKTWKDRISEHPTRRTLTDVSDNTTKTVNVAREEGTISQEGDAFSAANMNDLESRIAGGFSTLSQDSLKMSSSNLSSDSIKFGINASGQYGYIKQGTSEVTPFRNPTGNASPSDVLSGKTFSTASLENASGTRVDLGKEPEMKGGTLYNGNVYLYPVSGGDNRVYGIQGGVHASPSKIAGWSGGTLFTKSQYDAHYNQGVTDADNRANANSTNYKSGYNAGYSAGKSAAVAKLSGIKVSANRGSAPHGDGAQGAAGEGWITIDTSNYSSAWLGSCEISKTNSYVEATMRIQSNGGSVLFSLSTSGGGKKTGGNVRLNLSGVSSITIYVQTAIYDNALNGSDSYGKIDSITFAA